LEVELVRARAAVAASAQCLKQIVRRAIFLNNHDYIFNVLVLGNRDGGREHRKQKQLGCEFHDKTSRGGIELVEFNPLARPRGSAARRDRSASKYPATNSTCQEKINAVVNGLRFHREEVSFLDKGAGECPAQDRSWQFESCKAETGVSAIVHDCVYLESCGFQVSCARTSASLCLTSDSIL
jgi:hypothetical protein